MTHSNNAQLINQTSNAVDYYTPREIIEAARATMGGIDLDIRFNGLSAQSLWLCLY